MYASKPKTPRELNLRIGEMRASQVLAPGMRVTSLRDSHHLFRHGIRLLTLLASGMASSGRGKCISAFDAEPIIASL